MTRFRVPLSGSVLLVFATLPLLASAQYSPSGLSGAQLKQLHQLNIPVVAPVPPPKGFHVSRVVPNAYDKAYKIVYASQAGATIVFEANQAYGSSAQVASASGAAPAAAPKKRGHGLLQRIFGGATGAAQPPASNANRAGSTSSEAEGQGTAQLVADSPLIGPIRFTPAGPCLQGTADASKGTIHGLRVVVSACNSDNPEPLIAAYKSVHRI